MPKPKPLRVNESMRKQLETLYLAKEQSAEARAYTAAFAMAASSLGLDPQEPGLTVNLATGEFIRRQAGPALVPTEETTEDSAS